MPELPEVETVRRGLTRLVQGPPSTTWTSFTRDGAARRRDFTADLIGRKIEDGRRENTCSFGSAATSRWCRTSDGGQV